MKPLHAISWFVVHTQPLKEHVAKDNLLAQGFQVYVPRFQKIRRHARKSEVVLSPLFPRYVFVGMDPTTTQWRCINGTRGVAYLLTTSENTPARIPTSLIEDLKAKEDTRGSVPLSSLVAFTKGDKVRILDGPFKDQFATFETLDDKQRVHLLLTFMGREASIAVPSHGIEKI